MRTANDNYNSPREIQSAASTNTPSPLGRVASSDLKKVIVDLTTLINSAKSSSSPISQSNSTSLLEPDSTPLLQPKQVVSQATASPTTPLDFSTKLLKKHATLPEAQEEEYVKVHISHKNMGKMKIFSAEDRSVARSLVNAMQLRDKYIFKGKVNYSGEADITYFKKKSTEPIFDYMKQDMRIPGSHEDGKLKYVDGVLVPYLYGQPVCSYVKMDEYYRDFMTIEKICHSAPVASFCHKRMEILEERFKMHLLYNQDCELSQQKQKVHRDFYNVRKVDTHVHLAAAVDIKRFLRFVDKKLEEEPDTVVLKDKKTGDPFTLAQVFQRLGMDAHSLNVDSLDMQADANTFHRFDHFNSKYNPLGQSDLRSIFLSFDNEVKGRYLAELTKDLMKTMEDNKYEYSEWRVSVYGKSRQDAEKLADWIARFNVASHHNRWLIQIPRLYAIYKAAGIVKNFGELLKNIFQPLFEITLDPSKNPNLHKFLLQVTGFDSVDDESGYESSKSSSDYQTLPDDWVAPENPPYGYWNYYFYANITTLNSLRKARGLNTFSFRPHCGEAGPLDHLSSSYLVADGISHGIRLAHSTVLEYLYYLKQIGMAVSPISNNKLFEKYNKNPFQRFFRRGLNVSLSTDDPLILHLTGDPLLEEYAVAAEIWDFSSIDLCEIARNSVIQSGFEETLKKRWVGDRYQEKVKEANDLLKTNIPMARFQYRIDTFNEEMSLITYLMQDEAFSGQK